MKTNETLDLFFERVGGELPGGWLEERVPDDQRDALIRLFASSEFFRDLFQANASWALSELDWASPPVDTVSLLFDEAVPISSTLAEDEFLADLRQRRRRCMLHIVWSSFVDPDGLDRALFAMSALADSVIRQSLLYSKEQLVARLGRPVGASSGEEQALLVVAMGKMGGYELNLSSDIDIMFAYNDPGETMGGRKSVSNQEYFTRQAQAIIRYLDSVTADGRVFRVDTRLRPFGDSGALVANLPALETYYQEHGRNWERYALMKARVISLAPAQHQEINDLFRHFVYRRYIDFGIIDGLRDMKRLIETERVNKDYDDDVKRGRGGIREAEFIVQSHQLTRGGRYPELRCRGFAESIEVLTDAGYLDKDYSETLHQSYRFLRQVEHALQALADRQTHALPTSPDDQQCVVGLLNQPSWASLAGRIATARTDIAERFDALLAEPGERRSLLLAGDSDNMTIDRGSIDELGLARAASFLPALDAFTANARLHLMDEEGLRRLQRLLPLLCQSADKLETSLSAFERVLSIVEAVLRRSAYLSLLAENPSALDRLVFLTARSRFIADRLQERPELLDELLFPDRLFTAPSRDDIAILLNQYRKRWSGSDLEAPMQDLRRFKDEIVFRVAASELEGSLPLMKVSDNLSFLAEVILDEAVIQAKTELELRHGTPGNSAGFAILAYGKLGGLELNYQSDLDLVFVCDGESGMTNGDKPIENYRYFTRLAQKVIHILTTTMLGGRLYEVDLRLRPNGESGLLVTTLSALTHYLWRDAWTWEHQALVRARAVAGDTGLIQGLEALRLDVLAMPRDERTLRDDVVSMRQKMRVQSLGGEKGDLASDLKYGEGGIVDIEFVVQYLTLRNASDSKTIARWSDVVRLLADLGESLAVDSKEAALLTNAYLTLRSIAHESTIALTDESSVERAATIMNQSAPLCRRLLPGLQRIDAIVDAV